MYELEKDQYIYSSQTIVEIFKILNIYLYNAIIYCYKTFYQNKYLRDIIYYIVLTINKIR